MKNTKKKIACLALASALVIPGVMGLTGCNKGHTHAFNSDPYYEVVLEDGNKVARSWRECSCGAEDAHKKVDNAIIVNPTNIQTALDGKVVIRNGQLVVGEKQNNESYISVNDKTFVFEAGEYNDVIEFRPSKATSVVYTLVEQDEWALKEIHTGTLDDNTHYGYVRDFKNITFAGTKGAVFKNYIDIEAKSLKSTTPLTYHYDAVKEKEFTDEIGYMSYMNFENLEFTRMDFEGGKGRFYMYLAGPTSVMKNISINNCNFNTDAIDTYTPFKTNKTSHNAAVYTYSSTMERFTNVIFANNLVDGHYQGIYMQGASNAVITNNTIKNTEHNAISFNKKTDAENLGKVTIKGNYIENVKGPEDSTTRDRAIRFSDLTKCQIIIENNIFKDCAEDRTADNEGVQLLAANPLTDCSYIFSNNTYNGENLEDVDNNTAEFIVYIIEPTSAE